MKKRARDSPLHPGLPVYDIKLAKIIWDEDEEADEDEKLKAVLPSNNLPLRPRLRLRP